MLCGVALWSVVVSWPVVVFPTPLALFSDGPGRFEALFGGEPLQSSATIMTPWGETSTHTFRVTELGGTAIVSYWEYPLGRASPRQMLDSAVDAGSRAAQGEVREKRTISLNGISGVEILMDLPPRSTLRARFFIVDNRLYYVAFVSASDSFSDRAERFFTSFRILRTHAHGSALGRR